MEIDHFVPEFIEEMAKRGELQGIYDNLELISGNAAKVDYVLQIASKKFYELEDNYSVHQRKDSTIANRSRNLGNEYLQQKIPNLYLALMCYNRSICFARPNIDLGASYACRAMALSRMRRYKECLANIELAEQAGIPESMKSRIESRKRHCVENMMYQIEDPPLEEFELTFKGHPQLRYVSKCLDIKSPRPSMGRGVFTKRELLPTDLVVIEETTWKFLLLSDRYYRCANCLKENFFTLIPCIGCTATMYCNKDCMKSSYEKYHKFECPVLYAFLHLFGRTNLGLQVVYTYFTQFPNYKAAKKHFYTASNYSRHMLNVDPKKTGDLTEQLRVIQSLPIHDSSRSPAGVLYHLLMVALQKHYLFKYSNLKNLATNPEANNFLTELLVHYSYSSYINSTALYDIECHSYATALYPFCSMFNHSCAPNAIRVFRNGRCHVFIVRPIKPREQVFVCYGPHFLNTEKGIRLSNLSTTHRIDRCNCEACENCYPTESKIQYDPVIPLISYEPTIRTYDWARNYKRFRYILNLPTDHYPSVQVCYAEKSMTLDLFTVVEGILFKYHLVPLVTECLY